MTQGLAHRGKLTSQITTGLLDHYMQDRNLRIHDLAVSLYREGRDGTMYLVSLSMANALYAVTHNVTNAEGRDWRLATTAKVDRFEKATTIKGTRMIIKPLITARG